MTLADHYATHIFPVWPATYGRLTSLMPFSVGEWMLIAAMLLTVLFFLSLIAVLFLRLKKGRQFILPRPLRIYYRFLLCVFSIFLIIMILNCFLLYRCTPLVKQMETALAEQSKEALPDTDPEESAEKTLVQLRNTCVECCNTLALTLPRDDSGALMVAERSSITVSAQQAMKDAARYFPRLGGYQVRPKPLLFSDFVSQQSMSGYYFPFSMEAGYNNVMEPIHLPFTMCHELAHTHGYLREDECNFLAWFTCVTSEDPLFQYSGWLNVLSYLDRDFKKAVGEEAYATHPAISDTVRSDAAFLSAETKARIEETALFKTEDVRRAAEVYVDTTLKVNGIASGYENYAEVVRLMTLAFELPAYREILQ